MIEISHVSYKYNGSRQEVFEDLNLTLQESSLVGILGHQFHRSLSSLYAYPITQPTNVQQMNFSSDKPIYRRSDLVRFGLFSGSKYLWSFKGGVPNGAGIESHFDIYPIPGNETKNNPNMTQNPKY